MTLRQGTTFYRSFRIDPVFPPIPTRAFDYSWQHEDYDPTPEDSGGTPADQDRCGYGASVAACKEEIDFWWTENPE